MDFYDADGRSVEKDKLWVTLCQLAAMERYPFNRTTLSNMMRVRERNGLNDIGAIKMFGRVILVRLDLFEEWLESFPARTTDYRLNQYYSTNTREKYLLRKAEKEKAEQNGVLEHKDSACMVGHSNIQQVDKGDGQECIERRD